MEYVPDNVDMFEQHDAEQARWLERRPKCVFCGEHIQDDSAVQIAGEYYCDGCLDDMRVYIDD